jgi:hypothetical protein
MVRLASLMLAALMACMTALPALAGGAEEPSMLPLEDPPFARWGEDVEQLGRTALMDDWETAAGAEGGLLLYSWQLFELGAAYAPGFLEVYGPGAGESAALAGSLRQASATISASYWQGLAELSSGGPGMGAELVERFGSRQLGPDEFSAIARDWAAQLLSAEQLAAWDAQRIRPAASISELADWQDEPLAASEAEAGADEAAGLHSLVFHVPVNFNDGSPVPAELSERLERLVCERAGGFSVSPVDGAWEDGGKVYREPMRRFLVGLPEEKIAPFVDEIVALLKGDYAQLAVWVEIDGEPEIR